MIQSIKTPVIVDGNEKELCLDYNEDDEMVYFYLENKFLFSMDFEGNLKKLAEKIIEKW